jgi:hypothetical protein
VEEGEGAVEEEGAAEMGPQEVVLLACGAFSSAVLTDLGRVYTWGTSEFGALGHGGRVKTVAAPTAVWSRMLEKRRLCTCICDTCMLQYMGHFLGLRGWGLGFRYAVQMIRVCCISMTRVCCIPAVYLGSCTWPSATNTARQSQAWATSTRGARSTWI